MVEIIVAYITLHITLFYLQLLCVHVHVFTPGWYYALSSNAQSYSLQHWHTIVAMLILVVVVQLCLSVKA